MFYSYLKREKNRFSLKVPRNIQRLFIITSLSQNQDVHCTLTQEKKNTLISPFIIFLKGSFVRKMCCELNLKIMPKCFCPVIFRFEWLFAKYSNDAFCRSPSPAKVLNVFAGASKLSAEQKHQREQVNHLALTSGEIHFHIR